MKWWIEGSEILAAILMFLAAVSLYMDRREGQNNRGRLLMVAGLLLFTVLRLILPWFVTIDAALKPVSISAMFAALIALFALFVLPHRGGRLIWAAVAMVTGLGFLAGMVAPPLAVKSSRAVPLAWFYPHVVSALFGIAASMVAALSALLFLLQDRALKTGNLVLSARLPKVTVLGRILSQSIKAGALFYSTGLVLGSALAVYAWGKHFNGDAIEIGSVVGWLGQMGLYVAQVRYGWANRRLAVGTLIVTLFWLALVVLTGTLIPSEHALGGIR